MLNKESVLLKNLLPACDTAQNVPDTPVTIPPNQCHVCYVARQGGNGTFVIGFALNVVPLIRPSVLKDGFDRVVTVIHPPHYVPNLRCTMASCLFGNFSFFPYCFTISHSVSKFFGWCVRVKYCAAMLFGQNF